MRAPLPRAPLPIDSLLPELVAALRGAPAVVLEAPTGAGKTTRAPLALLEAGLAGGGEIVVLEPRRLAARLAARRVASELGERPGETVGWQVRFEEVAGPRTRLRYVTEALLTRRLLSEPTLPGVGAVVLDELHERHLPSDLALALLRRLQRGARPDLRLLAMSATLETEPVARFLGARVLRSEGRLHPVELEHLSPEDAARPLRLEERVAAAVRRVLREEQEGHVLVFLPGAAEIRRAIEALRPLPSLASGEVEVWPLHGDLSPEAQDRAVQAGTRRKVILSTNVAESSVTIEGVVAVVDSGLARVASHSPWSGLPELALRKVSQASAVQRAGRAGRTRPGRCLRLYTRHDHDGRPAHDTPEILRADLSETALALSALGVRDLEWLEPPPSPAWEAAQALLRRLGATGEQGNLTPLGGRLLRLPLHPRLARLVVAAEDAGAGEEGALLAALAGERDLRERWDRSDERARRAPTGPSDLLELAALFEEAARARFDEGALRRLGLAAGAVRAVERARRQLAGLLSRDRAGRRRRAALGAEEVERALLAATLCAFPDRVGRRRAPGGDELVMVGGGSVRLAAESVVREASLVVAVEAEARRGGAGARAAGAGGGERGTGPLVRLASAATPEQLLDLFPGSLRYRTEVVWNASAGRVEALERLLYQDLVLEEARAAAADPERTAAVLAEAALSRGARTFAEEGAVDRVVARVAFAARHAPESGLTPLTEEDVSRALRAACQGRRSFTELEEARLEALLLDALSPAERAALERLAPERIALPGGRIVKVSYPPEGGAPFVESRLQDFFGAARGPALAGGRVPLLLHLLAPNGRAVQVTTDLAGFWERHYPALRRELGRRYPRHAWPEDPAGVRPRTASAPAPPRTPSPAPGRRPPRARR